MVTLTDVEKRAEEIDDRLAVLTEELASVKGKQTEVYARIVGYFRSLKNWNKGKRDEYDQRVMFVPGNFRPMENVAPRERRDSFISEKATFKGVADFKQIQ